MSVTAAELKAISVTLSMGLFADGFDDLWGGIGHGIARDDGDAGFGEGFFAGGDVIALGEADDEVGSLRPVSFTAATMPVAMTPGNP